jgi:hypothetical protein
MAKKQSRRSVSLNRTTYERLKAFCETNDLSMSQFVEGRIADFLGRPSTTVIAKSAPVLGARPAEAKPAAPPAEKPAAPASVRTGSAPRSNEPRSASAPRSNEPRKVDEAAAKRAAERIFTF